MKLHPYLQKLLEQGWLSYHKYQFPDKDTWDKRLRRSKLFTKKYRQQKVRLGIENHIIKLTNFLPQDTKMFYRKRVLRYNLSPEEIQCEVPGCCELKKIQRSKTKPFYKTCGLKDDKHKKFNSGIGSKARRSVWASRTPEEIQVIEDRKIQRYIKNYGDVNPRSKSVIRRQICNKNYELITKEYIEKYFIQNGFLDANALCDFLECKYQLAKRIAKDTGANFKDKQVGGFNLDLPGIVYYIKDTITDFFKIGVTNNNVATRYGQKYKEVQEIKTWYFEEGSKAYEREQFLHNKFSEYRISNENFEGYGPTEFFDKDILGLSNTNKATHKKQQ